MNLINIILVLILMLLNFQYYNLNEESKILKETIIELKEQNNHLADEINKMSVINTNNSLSTNSTLQSVLYFGGFVLITGIALYFLNGYFFDIDSYNASKIVNQTTSEYTNNLMNQIHSQNLSQINWIDKKFDSLITLIHKANVFNNQWFIENVMPTLNQSYIKMAPSHMNNLNMPETYANFTQYSKIVECSDKLPNSLLASSVSSSPSFSSFSSASCLSLDTVSTPLETLNNAGTLLNFIEKDNIGVNNVLKVMEKTLETAEWI